MTKDQIIALASALKDIMNAAENKPYTPEELHGDDFSEARDAIAAVEQEYGQLPA